MGYRRGAEARPRAPRRRRHSAGMRARRWPRAGCRWKSERRRVGAASKLDAMGRLREGARTRGNHTVSTAVALAKCVPSVAVSLALEAALEAWQGRPLDSPRTPRAEREERASVISSMPPVHQLDVIRANTIIKEQPTHRIKALLVLLVLLFTRSTHQHRLARTHGGSHGRCDRRADGRGGDVTAVRPPRTAHGAAPDSRPLRGAVPRAARGCVGVVLRRPASRQSASRGTAADWQGQRRHSAALGGGDGRHRAGVCAADEHWAWTNE